ncbi:hypothetical protein HAX54_011387 [Datura stramonium]|uniref:Putative plant transposon protein domain-containing protein n=1 Tax=Datura stramonium TaxID=4076 RepID=A0ABS8Y0G2_DATST|nr:hypothetical protein [Datura stramonium]
MKEDEERRTELHRQNCPPLVRELYASYGASQKHKKETSPLRSRPCLEKVKVRGVEVDCSSKAINKVYFDDNDPDALELTPLKNDNEVSLARAILIACIMEGIHISVEDIISIEMKDRARQAHTSLPFLVLVMNLCRAAGVPKIERIDKNILSNQVIDITKIQDDMNPKLKKRKREPVVPHSSEITMGVESQKVLDYDT